MGVKFLDGERDRFLRSKFGTLGEGQVRVRFQDGGQGWVRGRGRDRVWSSSSGFKIGDGVRFMGF